MPHARGALAAVLTLAGLLAAAPVSPALAGQADAVAASTAGNVSCTPGEGIRTDSGGLVAGIDRAVVADDGRLQLVGFAYGGAQRPFLVGEFAPGGEVPTQVFTGQPSVPRPDLWPSGANPPAGAETPGFHVGYPVPDGVSHFVLSASLPRQAPEEPVTYRVLTRCTVTTAGRSPLGDLNAAWSPLPGAVELTGWAFDPSASDQPLDIHVSVDGRTQRVAPAARRRADVGLVYSWAGRFHGYDAVVGGLAPGAHQVCAHALNIGFPADNALLGCRTVQVGALPAGSPLGDLNEVTPLGQNAVLVSGWALDLGQPSANVEVHVSVDGLPRDVGSRSLGRAGGRRDDVAAAFPAAGPTHGFRAAVIGIPAGIHQVCAFAIDPDRAVENPLLGCRLVLLAGRDDDPVGDVNGVASPAAGTLRLVGWALQHDQPAAAVEVHAYVGGPVGLGRGFPLGGASLPRSDVAAAFPDAGATHGFDATLVGLSPGPTQVCLYAIGRDSAAGNNPLLGCRDVVIRGA